MMIAGEISGDLHGSYVVRELKRRDPAVRIMGVGGDRMQEAGMELLAHVNDIAVVGITEALFQIPKLMRVRSSLVKALQEQRPSVVCLIDYPGFNLRFAKIAKQMEAKVVYYISPQLWAWRENRVEIVRRFVDSMLVILPFEERFYREKGIQAQFVGHPLMEELMPSSDRKEFMNRMGISDTEKILALFPGSRQKEIESKFAIMAEAALAIAQITGHRLVVSMPVGFTRGAYIKYWEKGSLPNEFTFIASASHELLKHADFALVKSGTTTLEAALLSVPMVIMYRTSSLTHAILKRLVKIPFIGLPNIIAGRSIVPELIQEKCNAQNVAATALDLIRDPEKVSRVRKELSDLAALLGSRSASKNVADILYGTFS